MHIENAYYHHYHRRHHLKIAKKDVLSLVRIIVDVVSRVKDHSPLFVEIQFSYFLQMIAYINTTNYTSF